METIRERHHLLTLVINEKQDLARIGIKAELIADMCNFKPQEVAQLASCTVEIARNILKENGSGKISWFLVSNPQGEGGLEVLTEGFNKPPEQHSPDTEKSRGNPVIDGLKKIMDHVEVTDPHGVLKIRSLKWRPQANFKKMREAENAAVQKLFAETEQSCLENLKEKHEELLKLLEEKSRRNEELDRLNVELFHLNRDLEVAAAERAMSDMALRIAHEIRNPVTIVGGLVKLLLKDLRDDEKTSIKIHSILTHIKKLEEIVPKFENLASQRICFLRPENLVEIVKQSVDILRHDFLQKEVELQFVAAEPGPYMLEANQGMLKVAFTHILRNALAACKKGKKVIVRVHKHNRNYQVRIDDNGTGIPAEKMEHIFEPFFTTKPSRKGLGLPIVKQIVEEHRGRIQLQSEPGLGTIFLIDFQVFYLPDRSSET